MRNGRPILPFGTKLKMARDKAGITQKTLAAKVGVALFTVQRWEAGLFSPSIARLEKICQVLEVGPAKFIDY